ncbi:MAG: MFS transporter [Gammaproteobacteria bacterium]|nr:MFS transporter [Gammaproteobacteria bacterium]
MNDRAATLRVYADARLAKILLIGVISGFPWVLISSLASLWLGDEGYSLSSIGLFGYAFSFYALNFLWAPLLDAVHIPWLTRRLGHRRAWIAAMQTVILVATAAMYFLSPAVNLWHVAVTVAVIAAASATQDVAIDALRIELVGKSETALVAAAAAMATVGWYTGYNAGGAAALYCVDWLKTAGAANPWQTTYLLMTLFIIACNAGLLFVREAGGEQRDAAQARARRDALARMPAVGNAEARAATRAAAWLVATVWEPLADFFRSNGARMALTLLGFVFLFKIGEAFLGRMSLLFYRDVGFNEADIATYSKLIGWGTISFFAVIGSLFSVRFGLFRGLLICGIAMASTNLLFAWLAAVGPDRTLFAAAVILDQFTTAISTVAFVAFISQLCGRVYTATQYALLASLGNLARTTLSAHSGQLVDALGGAWEQFFIITALMVLPGLTLLLAARKKLAGYFTRPG